MKNIITPKEVIEIAFGQNSGVDECEITKELILEAQHRYIEPVLGELYGCLTKGRYNELLEGYIKQPLANYVKMLAIPKLSVSIGNLGVVSYKNSNMSPTSSQNMRDLISSIKNSTNVLMQRAVKYVEQNRNRYPEYDPLRNVLNRVSIDSGVIL